jgi:hypothetical protein
VDYEVVGLPFGRKPLDPSLLKGDKHKAMVDVLYAIQDKKVKIELSVLVL